jgi:hypothetical protein
VWIKHRFLTDEFSYAPFLLELGTLGQAYNCCIRPSPDRERIIDVVPRDGRDSNLSGLNGALGRQHTFANKTHVESRAAAFIIQHSSVFSKVLQTQIDSTQSYFCFNITAFMAGAIKTLGAVMPHELRV